MTFSLLQNLEFIADTLKEQRFDGLDQNPGGIRDVVTNALSQARAMHAIAERGRAEEAALMAVMGAVSVDPVTGVPFTILSVQEYPIRGEK